MKYSILLLSLLLVSCSALRRSPKYALQPGYYSERTLGEKVYVGLSDDTISIYGRVQPGAATGTASGEDSLASDSYSAGPLERIAVFPEKTDSLVFEGISLGQSSFDMDLLTIPLKLRPALADVPPLLDADPNVTFYIGMRSDKYTASYVQNPLGIFERDLSHLGFSAGIFAGLGSGVINGTVTENAISEEYEGILGMGGVAVIIAVENLTFGTAAGLDYLLDRNSDVWIYQGKPWLGITFGLNLY